MSALVEARGLAIAYESNRRRAFALDGADLTVERDESLALVGESGFGKTTLGMAVGRLLPREARREAGDLLIEGRSVFEATEAELRALRREKLGFVFQNPMTALDPTMRVGRQVALALGRRDGARDLLARVDLTDPERVMRSFPHQLSGGMAQRVVIAMAIARKPIAIVADEPTASLDASVRDRVMTTIGRLRAETRASLVILSHDLRMVAHHAKRIAVMYAGRPVETGCVPRVLGNPAHPYTRALLRSSAGGEIPGARLEPIAGSPPVLSARATFCAFAPRCPMRQSVCTQTRPEPRLVDERLVACHFAEAVLAEPKAAEEAGL
jgi:oligopeptide/dipeptide ABC transporter ATP-binding protein